MNKVMSALFSRGHISEEKKGFEDDRPKTSCFLIEKGGYKRNEGSVDASEFLRLSFSQIEDGKSISGLDRDQAEKSGISLLFGELKIEGVNRALDSQHLDAANATVLFDLGMGLGKLAIQAFLQFPNLKKIVGVEFAPTRYTRARTALQRISSHKPSLTFDYVQDAKEDNGRVLEFRQGNLFHATDARDADIIILQTDFKEPQYPELITFLNGLKKGVRMLTYKNLLNIYDALHLSSPFEQMAINVSSFDTFQTTWSNAHHFYLWQKTM